MAYWNENRRHGGAGLIRMWVRCGSEFGGIGGVAVDDFGVEDHGAVGLLEGDGGVLGEFLGGLAGGDAAVEA